ncbi:TPA: terminase [Streptococcus pyogenes]|nr:terminase [Streptococcus pyogenes]HEQ5604546.1 terminase [Streptococcus pyogenes]HEQ5627174.1 terminase [Streptococcus pyogenes]HEQ6378286.1 terminase [Streptococcus pyogenes]HEQ6419277.1 terminase [Streptococcus pyogenes]
MVTKTKTKLGNQRPTQSVNLHFAKSLAHEAINYYKKTGLSCYPWQENMLIPIMAVDEDGLWVHQKYGYAIPRRNGKTEVVYIVELWALHKGLKILHTAHRISTSHASFEKVKKYLEMSGYVDGEDFISNKAKGQERIEFKASGAVIQFRTRTSNGGLGEGFDLLIIDEAQEYTSEQESALKYTVTDSDNPMTIMCGTPPTMVSTGTVFEAYRKDCLKGNKCYSGWAEWSVPEMVKINDVSSWYISNPSMGFHLNERKIEAELGEDEIDHNIQRLGYWPSFNQKSVISEKEWAKLKVEQVPELKSKLFVGIKFGQDGNNVSLSIAARTSENKVFVETIDCLSVRNGTQWIINFLKSADIAKVVIDGASGQELLAQEMKDQGLKKPELPKVAEIITANMMWEQGIMQETICHSDQPSLTAVVTNCEKRQIGSNGGFGYKSLYDDRDISLMDSALLAHWICYTTKPKRKQRTSC